LWWSKLRRLVNPSFFDWIQVEVTSACNAACVYCPRTACGPAWQDRHLTPETFEKLRPALGYTRLVYLQGWGEPFLHPRFFALAASAKQTGCQVGVTSHGILLDEERIGRLVEMEFDLVALSLAGVGLNNNRIRRGTDFEAVLECLKTFQKIKARLKKTRPLVNVAYMLLRSGLGDLNKLPAVLAGLGVEQVVVSTLDFVPHPDLAAETLTPATLQEYEELRACLAEAEAAGKQQGVSIHYDLRPPGQRRPICTENIGRAFFVASDGQVSPCVYTNLPQQNAAPGAPALPSPYQPLIFGNINEEPLLDIWIKPEYVGFRSTFSSGELLPPCRSCLKR
jgi:MoaA/NifB/PqqE/SkfB family radical SAM enzyme